MKSAVSCSTLAVLCASMSLGCGGSTSPGTDQQDAASEAAAGGPGSGGAAGSGGTATGGAGGGGGGAAGTSDAGSCSPACGVGRTCCSGKCVNPANDPTNCGSCGTRCEGSTPFCGGTCTAPPCTRAAACTGSALCCGTDCCAQGQLCCDPQGPLDRSPVCYTPTAEQPTCPQGCAPLCISDRSLKRDIEPVDHFAVLDAVSKLPVSTWSYRSDPEGVRHMGPMAQDFKAAFGLGDTDRAYHSIDAHGVTLAAVQALYELSQEQSRKIEALERDNRALRSEMNALSRSRPGR